MKMDVEIKGMELNDGDREAAKTVTTQIQQTYSEKLKMMKGDENDGK